MVSSLGVVIAVGAAVAVAASAVAFIRLQIRAAKLTKRHSEFGQRFKRSGFAGHSAWDELETMPLAPGNPSVMTQP